MNEKLPQNQNEFNLDDLLPAEQPELNTSALDESAENMEKKLAAAERAVDVASRDHEARATGRSTSEEARQHAEAQLPSLPAEMFDTSKHNEEAMRRVRASSMAVAMAKGPKPDRSSTDLALSLFADKKDTGEAESAPTTESEAEPAETPAAAPAQKESWLRHPIKRFREEAEKVIPSDEELDAREKKAAEAAAANEQPGMIDADETATRFKTATLSRAERRRRDENTKAAIAERQSQQKEQGGEGDLIHIFAGPKPERTTQPEEQQPAEEDPQERKAVAVTPPVPAKKTAAKVVATPPAPSVSSAPATVITSGESLSNGLTAQQREELAAKFANLAPESETDNGSTDSGEAETVPIAAVTAEEATAASTSEPEAVTTLEPEVSLDDMLAELDAGPTAQSSSPDTSGMFKVLDRFNGTTEESDGSTEETDGSDQTSEAGESNEADDDAEAKAGRIKKLGGRIGGILTGNWRNETPEERQARIDQREAERSARAQQRRDRDAERYNNGSVLRQDRRQARALRDYDRRLNRAANASTESTAENEAENPSRNNRRRRLAVRAGGALLAGAALLAPVASGGDHNEVRQAPSVTHDVEAGSTAQNNLDNFIDGLNGTSQAIAHQAEAAAKAAQQAEKPSASDTPDTQPAPKVQQPVEAPATTTEHKTDTVEKKSDDEIVVTLKQDGSLYQAGIDGGLNDTEVMNAINKAHITDEMARSFQVGQQFDFHKDNGEWEVKILR